MKKFTWIFGLALLWGGLNAVAQQPIKSAADLVTAKDSLAKIDGYNKEISDNTSLLNTYTVQLKLIKPTVIEKNTTPTSYGSDEQTAIGNFCTKLMTGAGNDCSLRYKVVTTTGGWAPTSTLYIYTQGQEIEGVSTISTTDGITSSGTDITNGQAINVIRMCYKYTNKDGVVSYKERYEGVNPAVTTNAEVVSVLATICQNIPTGEVDVVTESEVLNEDYKTLMEDIVELKTQNSRYNACLDGAPQNNGKWLVYQVKVGTTQDGKPTCVEETKLSDKTVGKGCLAYKKLSIENSFKMTDATFTLGDWGTGYTINGNGNVITYNSTAEGKLINENNGAINNLGVINGKIAEVNNNSIKIAFETENTEDGLKYDIYDASGVHTESLMNGELAYRARPYFGVTINDNGTFGTLAKKTADNTVYKAEWTDAETKETTTFYTNATATDLSYNPVADKKNTFAYVLDTDLNTTNRLTEATNVVVNVIQKDGSTKFICKNAKFSDDVDKGSYVYIPTKFIAEHLSYNRSFKSTSDLATVCLPFAVSKTVLKTKGVTEIMQFDHVDTKTNTYWFNYQTGTTLKANEPYVLKCNGTDFQGGTIFDDLADIEVAATGNIDAFAVKPSQDSKDAEFRGVFVSTDATELAKGGNLYGFAQGKFRPLVISTNTTFAPFRVYVRTSSTSNVPAVTFNIGELDEDGNVVSDGGETGVNTAVEEADAFSVKGINGALIITSDKAQKVNVYTIGGSLVKATNVEAGSVTVPVAAGVYVVNGKKVFVK